MTRSGTRGCSGSSLPWWSASHGSRRREAVFVAPVVAMCVLMLVANPGLVTQWNGWYRLAIYPLVYVGRGLAAG